MPKIMRLILISFKQEFRITNLQYKMRHNARINPPRTQPNKHSTLRMKAALFAVGLNELLCGGWGEPFTAI